MIQAISLTGDVPWYMLVLAAFLLGAGIAAGMWMMNHILK